MNQEISDYVSQCSVCNMHRPDQCKEPMESFGRRLVMTCSRCRDSTHCCWSTIFSNCVELMRLSSSMRMKCVIDTMRSQFARHGLLMLDNCPQISCGEFRDFAQKWDFENFTSSPRYPQSNGQIERAIATVSRLHFSGR